MNIIWIVIFSIFAFGSVGDPQTCYISGADKQATSIIPRVGAVNWADKFKTWFIMGVVLGILNFIIYTFDTAAKLKKSEKGHAIAQMAGFFIFILSLGHVIWIAVLRFRRNGRIVSGDFL